MRFLDIGNLIKLISQLKEHLPATPPSWLFLYKVTLPHILLTTVGKQLL